MEGKLFPNENARNRLHRKVHGMGFVEMGKTMRDMWGNIDEVTKEVFCELADVGRVRYRNLMEEYKAKLESEQLSSLPINMGDVSQSINGGKRPGGSSNLKKSAKRSKKFVGVAASSSTASVAAAPAISAAAAMNELMAKRTDELESLPIRPHQAKSTLNPMLETLPLATTIKLKPAATPLSTAYQEMRTGTSFGRRVSTEFDFQASTRHQVQNFDHSDSLKPFSITKMANPAVSETSSRSSYGRRVSTKSAELDLGVDSFEPLSVATIMDSIANNSTSTTLECGSRPSDRRKVSTELVNGPVHGSTNAAINARSSFTMANSDANSFPNALQGSMLDYTSNSKASQENIVAKREYLMSQQTLLNNAIQKMQLKTAIQKMQESILRNAMICNDIPQDLPPFQQQPLRMRQGQYFSQEGTVGENSYREIMAVNDSKKGDVSAQDFMDFIGELDEVITDNIKTVTTTGASEEGITSPSSSFVFEKPMHELQSIGNKGTMFDTEQNSVPMPAAFELKNRLARMA
eukprot:CAMPEP_0196148366 /NCGR_PEP_ID=MMETSP0910-20130528/27577_1 /TAXON_ID=49265 /ORGANISM="Thalassiosira rotula, Strain GSO102" /LENGTH=519 /DNA_ID=CAMNT_0041411049 /DNA_START=18 /DNA_END=1577 /DNA_ORIENTATION=-